MARSIGNIHDLKESPGSKSNVSLKALRDHMVGEHYNASSTNRTTGNYSYGSTNISVAGLGTNATWLNLSVRALQESQSTYANSNNGEFQIAVNANTNCSSTRVVFNGTTKTQSRGAYAHYTGLNGGSEYTVSIAFSFNSSTYYSITGFPNATMAYNTGACTFNGSSLSHSGRAWSSYKTFDLG